ncbi:MAG TPA: biopolymer transporter ExbD [Gemmatimonadales bacterium]|nr:biopolymer transporter ExbD [Gemmatimonadales bacterium]
MAGIRGHGLGGRRRLQPVGEVNLVNLVDLAFVLLIIFMITAPLMQGGVDIELPRAATRPITPREGIVVTVDRSGRIFIDRTPVSYQEFRSSFRAVVARRGVSSVYVRGDRRAAYGDVVRVLAVIRESGVRNVGVTTEEEETGQ